MTSTDRRGPVSGRHASRLECGSLLFFNQGTPVPAVGELVPYLRNALCSVIAHEELASPPPATTVGRLRRDRFTLRVVAGAETEGLVAVDLVAGRVALRREGAAHLRDRQPEQCASPR